MKTMFLVVMFVVGLIGCQEDSKTALVPISTSSSKAKTYKPLCVKKDCQTEEKKAEEK